jgi:hypothetical protein
MATLPQPYLFSWREIEAQSDLARLRLVLAVLPDEDLVAKLEQLRGKGRDDYPVRPTLELGLGRNCVPASIGSLATPGDVPQRRTAGALRVRPEWRC